MKSQTMSSATGHAAAFALLLLAGAMQTAGAAGNHQAGTPAAGVLRGQYLVTIAGCNDCHTRSNLAPMVQSLI